MEQGKYTYSTFACIFVILIALLNFGRVIVPDYGAHSYRPGLVFPRITSSARISRAITTWHCASATACPSMRNWIAAIRANRRSMRTTGCCSARSPMHSRTGWSGYRRSPGTTPVSARLFVPFTFLLHPWAYRVYLGLLIAALFLALALLSGYARHRAHYWAICSALVAFSYPLRFELERGPARRLSFSW